MMCSIYDMEHKDVQVYTWMNLWVISFQYKKYSVLGLFQLH